MSSGYDVRLRWLGLVVVVAIWLASLPLPGLAIEGGRILDGWYVLENGWRGADARVLAWYGNPFFAAAVAAVALRRYRVAGVLSGLATVLGLTGFAAREIALGAGYSLPALSLQVGFFVWLGALFSLTGWSWLCWAQFGIDRPGTRP